MFRLLTLALALTLLLATQAAVAAHAREKVFSLHVESVSSRQDNCAECYDFESESICTRPLQTPVQATDKAGNLLWAAHYNAFGRASIITPAATSNAPTIDLALRLPGQYEDTETGLHYNLRRYYDPETGRYWTQDPIGLEGGINLFGYAHADPINLTDPTGEAVPIVAGLIAGATCMASCMATTAAEDLLTGECTSVGTSAKNCAIGCAMGGVGVLGVKAKRAYDRLPCAINSFPADTMVHVQPADIAEADSNPDIAAARGQSQLKRIQDLQPGDKVLALAEWKEAGNQLGQDQRLSYEKVTDVFTSLREQTLIHLTLDNGEQLTATQGHPFLTSEGWRDAILLKRGGKLLIKGEADADADAEKALQSAVIYKPNQPYAGIESASSATKNIVNVSLQNAANQGAIASAEANSERYATITDIREEVKTIPVYNLEVAHLHTYFIGLDGVVVHNGFGSYTCHFKSGKKYHGKGDWDRAKKSGRDKSKGGDDLDFIDWTPAANDRDSFRDEHNRMKQDHPNGSPNPSRNYNQRHSPGRRY